MSGGENSFDFNGIDALSGRPLLRLDRGELARLARGEKIEPTYFKELRNFWHLMSDVDFDPMHGVDARDLAQTGWGVIWPHQADPAVREALQPLLELRRAQAGELFRELTWRPGEAPLDFLARHGVGPGPVDPRKLPYYLLIAGTPEEVPFRLQYRLDVQFAVGRLGFDQPEGYANYVRGVLAAETGAVRRRPAVSLFAPAHRGDPATQRASADLVEPLAALAARHPGFAFECHLREAATKATLTRLLGGGATPALAFTACHGLGFSRPHPAQERRQGALVCQDWGGPDVPGAVPPGSFFAADDVGDDADLAGMVAFLFACYGAGTPRHEEFFASAAERQQLAERDFVARLPQRLLGHPRGGALAVIGHVERAWTYSFDWPQAGPQRQVFESAIGRILDGFPVGAAMEHFGQRFAELSIDVKAGLDDLDYEPEPDVMDIAGRVLAFKDARSYVLLGDPAVKLGAASRAA